jgi:Protein of unknown function (DUF3606)
MAEEQPIRGPLDYGYVNMRSEPERRYWTKELGCSEQQLIDAVTTVGPLVVEVKRHIGMRLEESSTPEGSPRAKQS